MSGERNKRESLAVMGSFRQRRAVDQLSLGEAINRTLDWFEQTPWIMEEHPS